MRREPAELFEFRDPVRLIGIAECECGMSRIRRLAGGRTGKARLKSGQSRVELGRNTHALSKHTSQVLTRDPGLVGQLLHSDLTCALLDRRGKARHIH